MWQDGMWKRVSEAHFNRIRELLGVDGNVQLEDPGFIRSHLYKSPEQVTAEGIAGDSVKDVKESVDERVEEEPVQETVEEEEKEEGFFNQVWNGVRKGFNINK